jgi:hypothetical protein
MRAAFVVAVIASLALPDPSFSQSSGDIAPARRLVLVGVEFGAINVDLPHPEEPGATFGERFRLGMQLGYEVTRQFALDAELGFSFLGESDSLNAALAAQGREEGAAYTLVDFCIGALARWPLGEGRWAPFVRATAGLVSLALSSPDLSTRETDPSWSAGGGMEFALARPVVLRFQARWMGQQQDGEPRHHVTGELAVFYALHTNSFSAGPAIDDGP